MYLPIKDRILNYIKQEYTKNHVAPTLSNIINHFKADKLSIAKFYKIFPEKLSQALRLAGVPVPVERINKTSEATAKLKARKKPTESPTSTTSRLVLTQEQEGRVLGISQLEGGLAPSLIIDKMLNLDTEMRKEYHLNLKEIKLVSQFLNDAHNIEWTDSELLKIITHLSNNGFMKLNANALKDLNWILSNYDKNFWGSINDFLTYVNEHASSISAFKSYLNNEISIDQMYKIEGLERE